MFPMMLLWADGPGWLDMMTAEFLASLLGRHPLFDLSVQSAIRHNVLGGVWFGATLFILWIQATQPHEARLKSRLLATMLGSALAIVLTVPASLLVSWTPPNQTARLRQRYPAYLDRNINANSFPSQSTAAYTAIALGLLSVRRRIGGMLLCGALLLVGLPRMYVGGHYLTDVLAGLLLGGLGASLAILLLEPRSLPKLIGALDRSPFGRLLLHLTVFAWILQVSVGFREIIWVRYAIPVLWDAIV